MRNRFLLLTALALLIACSSTPANPNAERFVANAFNLSGGGPSAGLVTITVDHWSSRDDLTKLQTAFKSGGADKLLNELQSLPVCGRIFTQNYRGTDLHFCWQRPETSGRSIYFLTDRWMGFVEMAHAGRSTDSPFTFAEIHLDAQDHGEGKLSYATEITYNEKTNTVEMENWSTQPVQLKEVRRE